MNRSKKINFCVLLIFGMAFHLIYFGCHSAPSANPVGSRAASNVPLTPGSVGPKGEDVIESILLMRRNWESHGTDTRIERNGRFLVEGVFLRSTKKVREGRIAPRQWEDLVDLIHEIEVSNLMKQYEAPFKTERGWWGYEVLVQTTKKAMTVRFHSEDDTVPNALKELVTFIMEVSK